MEHLVDKFFDTLDWVHAPVVGVLIIAIIYLARQNQQLRDAMTAADKADREFAKTHTETLRDVAGALGKIEGLLMRGGAE